VGLLFPYKPVRHQWVEQYAGHETFALSWRNPRRMVAFVLHACSYDTDGHPVDVREHERLIAWARDGKASRPTIRTWLPNRYYSAADVSGGAGSCIQRIVDADKIDKIVDLYSLVHALDAVDIALFDRNWRRYIDVLVAWRLMDRGFATNGDMIYGVRGQAIAAALIGLNDCADAPILKFHAALDAIMLDSAPSAAP
jgi:hypothetical protein